MRRLFAGIDFGASTIKSAAVSTDLTFTRTWSCPHQGNIEAAAADVMAQMRPHEICGWVVTGREGSERPNSVRVPSFEALAEGLRVLGIKASAAASIGAETLVVYPLGADGSVTDALSGSRCAAGSDGMYAEQLARMGITVEESEALGRTGRIVPLARRCSVHRKSDCTHAINTRRCEVPDIIRTLCHGLAQEVASLVGSGGIRCGTLALSGGGASNGLLVEHLRALLPREMTVIVPPEATHLEALGAAALARGRGRPETPSIRTPASGRDGSFSRLPPLSRYADRVVCDSACRGTLHPDEGYILGIDGGSTTTKVALVAAKNRTICASHYTRTGGDPVKALRRCVEAIREGLPPGCEHQDVRIEGIATTGSAGQALALLCGTPWHHNEIIAHAQAVARLCPQADTILEIGGQDAKFTRLRSGIPVDFAMNGSCAAGTGSFIEEAALAELGTDMEDIAALALRSHAPLRFSDQCAAFVGSDIRKAIQEGASREDILAGLAYAVADNYLSKVVGRRPLGKHVLFQGGTSKNRAIALALAARTGKPIVVPPEPELMGCYGIALWLTEKTNRPAMEPVHLRDILAADLQDAGAFTCEACDNQCRIQRIRVGGRTTPFGGRCFRWSGSRPARASESQDQDHVAVRNRILFAGNGTRNSQDAKRPGDLPPVGLIANFTTSTFYPLYATFLRALGHPVTLAEAPAPDTTRTCPSERCYPYELAYGMTDKLLAEGVRQILIPHVVREPSHAGGSPGFVCPMSQGAPYYLREFVADHGATIHSPVLDMQRGVADAAIAFTGLGEALGHTKQEAQRAFSEASVAQEQAERAIRAEGTRLLAELERSGRIGIVIVGRPYNAFSPVMNMGIPRKIASTGVAALPYDMLPWEKEACFPDMHWSCGQSILRTLRAVKRHPLLFPVYIGNFGCGPDAFILHGAADIMGKEPWLYLELDSHAADAGIDTRIEAFLDVASSTRAARPSRPRSTPPTLTPPATKSQEVLTLRGEHVSLTDPRILLAYPSMGAEYTEAMAAVSSRFGVRTVALPPATERILALGREVTSGRECLPALLTTGALVDYLQTRFRTERKDDILVYFMPTNRDPCRFSQYHVFIRNTLRRLGFADTAIWSPSAEDGYRALGFPFLRAAWQAVTVAALMRDIRPVLKVAARERESALRVWREEWQALVVTFARGTAAVWPALRRCAQRLAAIELETPPERIPKVLLVGEIFARFDDLCCHGLEDIYAAQGIAIIPPPVLEWLYYSEWCDLNQLANGGGYPANFLGMRGALRIARQGRGLDSLCKRARLTGEAWVEKAARRLLAPSGLLCTQYEDIDTVVRRGAQHIDPALTGEAILTVGAARSAMDTPDQTNWAGLALLGPFNCMPCGVAESILKPHARRTGIPWVTLECDGSPWPSNTRQQIEVHMRQVQNYASRTGGVT